LYRRRKKKNKSYLVGEKEKFIHGQKCNTLKTSSTRIIASHHSEYLNPHMGIFFPPKEFGFEKIIETKRFS